MVTQHAIQRYWSVSGQVSTLCALYDLLLLLQDTIAAPTAGNHPALLGTESLLTK
jgi:hypothetical protein